MESKTKECTGLEDKKEIDWAEVEGKKISEERQRGNNLQSAIGIKLLFSSS